jgi:mitochondrial fission protein ELM1
MDAKLRCWVVSDGTPGMENQALGLAQVLGFEPAVKRIRGRKRWSWIPALLGLPFGGTSAESDSLDPPFPDVVIATGRGSIAPALDIKRRNGGRTFTVQIQNPGLARRKFDVVVAPAHDRLSGPNVVVTKGSMNGITPAVLAEAAKRWGPKLARVKRPVVAVLVGGDNKVYRLTEQGIRALCAKLKNFAARYGAGLLVTPSRRTGAANEAILRAELSPLGAEIWDGAGENPYLGYLGLADFIVVTGDSVNMVCEACATGKPVYVFDLEGGSAKFRRFHARMRADGLTRPLGETLETWDYPPLTDTAEAAAEIKRRLAAFRRGLT